MSRRGPWAAVALAVMAALAPFAPTPARADAAPADSALERFVGSMSDSTDRFFGSTVAPTDTTGLDSARTAVLSRGYRPPRSPLGLNFGPSLRFNRADGMVWGAKAGFGPRSAAAGLRGHLEYASGLERWRGSGEWQPRPIGPRRTLSFSLWGGSETAVMDRARARDVNDLLASIDALTRGADRRWLYQRSGIAASVTRAWSPITLTVGARDMFEQPLAVTTGWDLAHHELEAPGNLAAARGRARELELAASVRAPFAPISGRVDYRSSRRAAGSDFEYRLVRSALGGEFGLGRYSSLVAQAVYGRLNGEAPAQECFYLDGTRALGRKASFGLGGSALALGRIDWIGTRDVLAAARIPHPSFLPLQLGTFAASGTVWGADPFGGPSRPGVDWPQSADWRSEAGLELVWQPGIPDPLHLVRFELAWPLGPRAHQVEFTVAITRPLFLLEPLGR